MLMVSNINKNHRKIDRSVWFAMENFEVGFVDYCDYRLYNCWMGRSERGLFGLRNRDRALPAAEQPQKPEWRERDDIPLPLGTVTLDRNGPSQVFISEPVLFLKKNNQTISGEITSTLKGYIRGSNHPMEFAILPPFENESTMQDKASLQDLSYGEISQFKREKLLDELQRKPLHIENNDDITLIIHDPELVVRGKGKVIGQSPKYAKREILATAGEKLVVDYRPANKKANEPDIPEDEREMAEILEEVERILDLKVDLLTLQQIQARFVKVHVPEIFTPHMQALGRKIAEKQHEIEEKEFKAAVRAELSTDLLKKGKDIILRDTISDRVEDRQLSTDDELLINLLDDLRESYKEEVREEDEKEMTEEDRNRLLRKLKRLGRRKKELSTQDNEKSNFRPSGIEFDTDKYKDKGLILFGGDMFNFIIKSTEAGDALEQLFRDISDKKKYKIVGDIEELTIKGEYKVEVIGNVQKIEAHDGAVVEVDGKVAAAVALDESEVYASGRIKRKRKFGESVIREYDGGLERYE